MHSHRVYTSTVKLLKAVVSDMMHFIPEYIIIRMLCDCNRNAAATSTPTILLLCTTFNEKYSNKRCRKSFLTQKPLSHSLSLHSSFSFLPTAASLSFVLCYKNMILDIVWYNIDDLFISFGVFFGFLCLEFLIFSLSEGSVGLLFCLSFSWVIFNAIVTTVKTLTSYK